MNLPTVCNRIFYLFACCSAATSRTEMIFKSRTVNDGNSSDAGTLDVKISIWLSLPAARGTFTCHGGTPDIVAEYSAAPSARARTVQEAVARRSVTGCNSNFRVPREC